MAALSLWTHYHAGSLGAMCALHKLKFNFVTFIQGSKLFSNYRCGMDKDIWTVAALNKTISPNVTEPFHFANHAVSSKSDP